MPSAYVSKPAFMSPFVDCSSNAMSATLKRVRAICRAVSSTPPRRSHRPLKFLSTSPFSIAYSSIDCCHPQKSTRLLKTASVDDSFVSSAILVPSWSSREYSYKQKCEKLRTLEKLFSPDTFELHSPSEVSDHATCLFCDQQEFDRGAERSVMLKGCYGRCEN